MKRVPMTTKPTGGKPDPDAWIQGSSPTPPAAPPTAAERVPPRPAQPEAKPKRLTIDLEPTLHAKVKVASAQAGRTMAEMVREILAERFS
jgi:hypothetical protein